MSIRAGVRARVLYLVTLLAVVTVVFLLPRALPGGPLAAGEEIPWLASDWSVSDDGTEWRFTIRDGVRWHDGEPLTVDDVVFTFDYLREGPGSTTSEAQGYEVIESVTAEGDEVAFELAQNYAGFAEDVAGVFGAMIIPQHIWADVTEPEQFLCRRLRDGDHQLRRARRRPGLHPAVPVRRPGPDPVLNVAHGYQNDRFDELADQQATTADRQQRLELVAEMQRILAEDVPIIPLLIAERIAFVDTEVFDAWYFTPACPPCGATRNKHMLVTGRTTGLGDAA